MTVSEILLTYRVGLLNGLEVTIKLCLVIWVVGLAAGILLGWSGARVSPGLGILSRGLSFTVSSIPVLVLLFWMHYPLQALAGVVIDPFLTAAACLTIINALGVADIVRNSLKDFPKEYATAARVCGLSQTQIWRHIEFPMILRQTLPALLTLQVAMLQASLFASLISVDELFRTAQRINAEIYKPVQVYSTLGVFFMAICLPLNALANWMRIRFTRNLSER